MSMALKEHIKRLILRRKGIEDQIHNEEKRPLPNTSILHKLKWRRLVINDEIKHLRA